MNRMMKFISTAGTVTAVVALVVIGTAIDSESAFAQGRKPRVIHMEPLVECTTHKLQSCPGAMVVITEGEDTVSPIEFFTVSVSALPTLQIAGGAGSVGDGQHSYALYANTCVGRLRVLTFNTLTGKSYQGFPFVPTDAPFSRDVWFVDPITLEIYVEEDDGNDAPDIGGLMPVLRGSD